jgi:hypothetical protein
MYIQDRYRWLVKESHVSGWSELPGEHTAGEISLMRENGDIVSAMPVIAPLGMELRTRLH